LAQEQLSIDDLYYGEWLHTNSLIHLLKKNIKPLGGNETEPGAAGCDASCVKDAMLTMAVLYILEQRRHRLFAQSEPVSRKTWSNHNPRLQINLFKDQMPTSRAVQGVRVLC
jgi:hypothetical protein